MNKQYRIKKNSEIELVLKKGKRAYSKYFTIYTLKNNETSHFRFATSVGKKIGNAVVRNLTKRRIRSVIDKFNLKTLKVDVFIIAKPNINKLKYDGYVKEIEHLFKRLNLI